MTDTKRTAQELTDHREALQYLHDQIDAYFGPSKAGPCWPKFLDDAMYKARGILSRASVEAEEKPQQDIRNAVIEECAKICDMMQCRPEFEPEIQDRMLAAAARSIRALKADPAQEAEPVAEAALRKLCDQLEALKRTQFKRPGTGQTYSYIVHEDVEAYIEEARRALKAEPAQEAEPVAEVKMLYCPKCLGTGKLMSAGHHINPCSRCNNTGRVPVRNKDAAPIAHQAVPEAVPVAIPRRALTEFINGYCMNKSELTATAESAFYWFNKALAGAPEAVEQEQTNKTLQQLGKRLAELLDADHWNNIEPMLLSLAAALPPASGEARDAKRLDWLDEVNRKTNERYGTTYGWKFDINHNRAALMDHNFPALTIRQAIDEAMNALENKNG